MSCGCGSKSPYIQCNTGCTGYPEPHCGGNIGGHFGNGGNGHPGGGYPGGGGPPPGPGYYQAPPPSWEPIPMTAQPYNGGGLMAVAQQLAGQVGQYAAGMLENRRLCSPWKTDGVNDHKICCTPSVGKGGVKIAACIKLTRPHDPWANKQQLPLGTFPGYPPIG